MVRRSRWAASALRASDYGGGSSRLRRRRTCGSVRRGPFGSRRHPCFFRYFCRSLSRPRYPRLSQIIGRPTLSFLAFRSRSEPYAGIAAIELVDTRRSASERLLPSVRPVCNNPSIAINDHRRSGCEGPFFIARWLARDAEATLSKHRCRYGSPNGGALVQKRHVDGRIHTACFPPTANLRNQERLRPSGMSPIGRLRSGHFPVR
jgi:hypothetical protein